MALYSDLPVYKSTYDLLLAIFRFTKDFGKEYKFTLGQDLKRDGKNLVRSIYRANKSKENYQRHANSKQAPAQKILQYNN